MSESEITSRPTVRVPGWMNAEIEDELGYNDTKCEWIREACRQRLDREGDVSSSQ